MAPVEVRDLCKQFGDHVAVDNLSFDVEAGRVTGFLGPNGAGKSTTLRALHGLISPSSGSATFGGQRYDELEQPTARVGAVLEDASFHPGRSARNHLRVLAVTGGHPAARVDDALATVGLREAADRRVNGYSLGMRQRLAVAAALLGDPEVLILDEPTNGLDLPGISWMRELLLPLVPEVLRFGPAVGAPTGILGTDYPGVSLLAPGLAVAVSIAWASAAFAAGAACLRGRDLV